MNRRRTAMLALGGATVAVSVSAILIQEARTDAATVVWLRMAMAAVLLSPWAVPQLRAGAVGGTARDRRLTTAAGILLAVHFLAWTASLAYTTVAASVLLVSLHPLIVAPLGARLQGDRVDARVLAGIGLAVAGTAVMCAAAFRGAAGQLTGDLLALLGAVAIAGYLLIGRDRRGREGVVAYSAVVYVVVCVAAVAAVAVGGNLHAPSARTAVACLGLAAICTVGGHTVFNWTLRHLPAGSVSLSFLGEGPIAALLAFVILGQAIPLTTVIGGALILAGVAVTLTSYPWTVGDGELIAP